MDVAMLLIAVVSLIVSASSLVALKFYFDNLQKQYDDYQIEKMRLAEASKILGELHNEQMLKVKSIGERIENMELRIQGATVKRGF